MEYFYDAFMCFLSFSLVITILSLLIHFLLCSADKTNLEFQKDILSNDDSNFNLR